MTAVRESHCLHAAAQCTTPALALVLMLSGLALPATAHATKIRDSAVQSAMPITPAQIDDTVARAMQAFQVPGVAVGIVKDGQLVFARGYGVREAGKPARVDADTLFQIGSNTKAFTAAALAILVDEGRIRWDDRVVDYLPQFRLYDPYVTREFTIRDLLTHRSGLGPGAGDLMFFPATDMSRDEIMHGLRYLKPVASFRASYAYDNLLYMVAGQVIPAVTGKSWEDFVTQRILEPLHMAPCAASHGRIADRRNLATPHVAGDDGAQPVAVVNMDVVGPAGTINCSITGMAKWLQTQLAAGKTPTGEQLFSTERGAEMWTLTTPIPLSPLLAGMYQSHFAGYALGWYVSDTHGYKRVDHTGGVLGSVTWVSMIPELSLGVLVLTNQQNGGAIEAIGGQILDAWLGVPSRDWVAIAAGVMNQREDSGRAAEEAVARVVATAGPPPFPLDAYAGTYHDSWRGDAWVRRAGDHLELQVSRTVSLTGRLEPYRGNVFIVRWNEPGLDADAYVRFEQGFGEQVVGMTLQAVSPATDFSFDFQDLDFRKVKSVPAGP